MKVRNQSGCVVFRYGGKHDYEILLISSSNGKKWGFPKGGIEPDLSAKESALKETYEEAGVTGHIVKKLGSYRYRKAGRDQHVVMYAMLYTKETKDWPEKKLRKRKWVSIKKARKMLPSSMVPFLDQLEAKDHTATASATPDAYSKLFTLPVLRNNGAQIELEAGGAKVTVNDLEIKVVESGASASLTYSDGTRHGVQKTTLKAMPGAVGRICSRYISDTL